MEGNDKINETGKKKTIVYAIIAACVLGIVVIGALVINSSNTSEGFSELYFEDNQKLPKIVNAGQDVRFNFTLVSHEKTPVTYRYNVTFNEEMIEEGTIRLEPEKNKTHNVLFVPNNSSLVPYDVSYLVAFNSKLNPNGEVNLPLYGSAGESITINLRDAEIPEWNFTEIGRVGSLDNLVPTEQSSMSTLGYKVRKDRYSIGDAGELKTLNYSQNVTEYRYRFEKVAVNVTSENETATKVGENGTNDQTGRQVGKGKAYEIHFWTIVKEVPEKLLAS